MKREKEKPDEIANMLSIISIAVVALLLVSLFKVKGGILGMLLGSIAAVALIYWLKEIKKIFREGKAHSQEEVDWFYDLVDEEENLTLTAKVPGPAEEVKVRLVSGMLEIRGGGNFMRKVNVPEGAQLQNHSYINGVLHVKLQRTETPNSTVHPK